ncbi:MAG TPA: LytTR family transcriptional regulator [Desulfocapsa sulfexigens]|nr:LytTR family transcriptional regulator [Desulfocapsa sulfexigens]
MSDFLLFCCCIPPYFNVLQINKVALELPPRSRVLKVSEGESVRLLNIDEVYYFQAADKYTRVVCDTGEELIRTSIKQLSISLDPERFWQIHRATIVNVESIKHASRSFSGRYRIHLKKNSDILTVSRTYGHLFKQM